jgi:hypothetical protein
MSHKVKNYIKLLRGSSSINYEIIGLLYLYTGPYIKVLMLFVADSVN